MPNTQHLNWTRGDDRKYRATDGEGNRWHITQTNSRRWTVYCNGIEEATWPVTLDDAKWAAEEEAIPERKAAAAIRKAKREANRAARESRKANT